jgi:hypothetical protein
MAVNPSYVGVSLITIKAGAGRNLLISFIDAVIAIALFDYHAKYDDDLTFERGDWFAITQMDEGGWYMAHAWNAADARWVGKYGYVPSNFLQPAK